MDHSRLDGELELKHGAHSLLLLTHEQVRVLRLSLPLEFLECYLFCDVREIYFLSVWFAFSALKVNTTMLTEEWPVSPKGIETQKMYNIWNCSSILSRSHGNASWIKSILIGASLVAQWLRICLPVQWTRVRALVWEDPTCRAATKPVRHNYWACALEPVSHNFWARVLQLLKPACLEPMLRNRRSHHSERTAHCNEEWPPLAATRESPRAATKTQRSQK